MSQTQVYKCESDIIDYQAEINLYKWSRIDDEKFDKLYGKSAKKTEFFQSINDKTISVTLYNKDEQHARNITCLMIDLSKKFDQKDRYEHLP